MSSAPKTITDIMAVWTRNGGVNLGIVGNTVHTVGYHLGKDRIYDGTGPGLGDNDYSVKLPRDKAGLTNYVAGLDFGRLNGSLVSLQKFSLWLVDRCKSNAPGTNDIREIIFSPDGKVVKRWDNNAKVLYAGGSGTGQGDDSHITHTHISFFRDSENRDKTGLISPYFAAVPAPVSEPTGGDMPNITTYLPGFTAIVGAGANIRSEPSISTNANVLRTQTATDLWTVVGWVTGSAVSGSDQWLARWNGRWEYCHKVNVVGGPTAPVGTAPDATTCKPFADAARLDGYAAGKTDGMAIGEPLGLALGIQQEKARVRSLLGL